MPLLTCSKRYHDIPFAHRQHKHDGHCAHIHGHNWAFELTFACDVLDECGFVIDFGKLGAVKKELMSLDHALLINEDDPFLEHFCSGLSTDCATIIIVPDCSCEGLLKYFWLRLDPIIRALALHRGVRLHSLTIEEDSKNWATLTE
jgi:6-pyruvoyltetrahydropterin/6-carboxytetrahydropterin synthase